MSPKTYTTREVAKLIGVSHQTLHTWVERKHIKAPKSIAMGKTSVLLWEKSHVDEAREFKGSGKLRPGPRAKKKK
jgi:excisionase family DNA binding protein